MIDKFINRPVLATVLSIIIFLMGMLGLSSLPVTQFPDIAPPMVQVTTNYLGANAEVVLRSVIAPLEEQINGVENMTHIESTAGNDGSAEIKIFFNQGIDVDMAAVNVQNRVSAASNKLPASVVSFGITTQKSFNSSLMFLAFYSTNSDYDAVFVENYVKINVYPELQRVKGVGRVQIFGMKDYSMRVWLKPERLAAYALNPEDVIRAIAEQNIEAAPGKFGENTNSQFTYTIKYKGKFVEPSEYENIVIKATDDGKILRLKDIARVEFGAFDYSVFSKANGYAGTAMSIYQMAGGNAREIVDNIKAVLKKMEPSLPDGIKYSIPQDSNLFLNESIKQVITTFIEAFILVFIVVFLFLQDFKSTLIPIIASIVAIVGTFLFLLLFGFSLNILTLFAMVLAIGMVVDDAIVVVEAVHSKVHNGEKDIKKATSEAMHEITGAIISITFVMSAVFFPVAFMDGPTGVFYKQFALTMAVAMILSAINALTLSPVLCTLFIKPKDVEEQNKSKMQRFYDSFNTGFDAFTQKYSNALKFFVKKKSIIVLSLILIASATFYLIKITPTGFIPSEDQGTIFADIQLPLGASRERTDIILDELNKIALDIPEVKDVLSVAGISLLSGNSGGSYGLFIISLVHWDDRPDITSQDILNLLRQKTSHIKEANIIFFTPPTVSGFGMAEGFELRLQDKTGGDTKKFFDVSQEFIGKLMQQPEILYATTSFNINLPQYEFNVNVNKCKLMGININDVFKTLQTYYGSAQASDFNRFTKYYRVMVQAEPEDRNNINSLSKIMIRNDKGEMVPITTFVSFKQVYGPVSMSRYNLFLSANINGATKPGYSSGDAIAAISKLSETLPIGYDYEFTGMSREETNSGGQAIYVFILCFIFVYLILAAQYESYIIPLSIMISLVLGIFGVYLFIWLAGIDNNIYVQVALIMLIGLLAKNGILIVEFAVQRRNQGLSIVKSAIEAAQARLRPILMTSFAFIFGMTPLIIASGAGANGNISIGTAAAGGMLVGTMLGIFVIPVLYVIFKTLDEKISPSKTKMIEVKPTKNKPIRKNSNLA